MNNLQVRQQETKLAETKEAKVLLPILQEYANLYQGTLENEPVKKKNILILANELSKIRINERPAIEVATPASIREVALKVITEDIDLSKKQANIIPYGNELTLQKQFYGNVALAKQQYGNNIEFYSQVVYPKDKFEIIKNGYGIGRDKYNHETKPENMTNGLSVAQPTFVYTYVVDVRNDKVIATNCFSYARCFSSWTQSGIKPTHKKFPAEMMIKSSESYLATRLYNKANTDNDNQLQDEYEYNTTSQDDNTIMVESFNTNETPEPIINANATDEDFDIEAYIQAENANANDINNFLDDDDDADFAPNDVEPIQPQEKPKRTRAKVESTPQETVETQRVLYRDFKNIYESQGYVSIDGTWDQTTRTVEIKKANQ